MKIEPSTPYKAHLIICKTCHSGQGEQLKKKVKAMAKEEGLVEEGLRVSAAQCLGLCKQRCAAVLYPSQTTFSDMDLNNATDLLNYARDELKNS